MVGPAWTWPTRSRRIGPLWRDNGGGRQIGGGGATGGPRWVDCSGAAGGGGRRAVGGGASSQDGRGGGGCCTTGCRLFCPFLCVCGCGRVWCRAIRAGGANVDSCSWLLIRFCSFAVYKWYVHVHRFPCATSTSTLAMSPKDEGDVATGLRRRKLKSCKLERAIERVSHGFAPEEHCWVAHLATGGDRPFEGSGQPSRLAGRGAVMRPLCSPLLSPPLKPSARRTPCRSRALPSRLGVRGGSIRDLKK